MLPQNFFDDLPLPIESMALELINRWELINRCDPFSALFDPFSALFLLLSEKIIKIAKRRGISSETLINLWLKEKIDQFEKK